MGIKNPDYKGSIKLHTKKKKVKYKENKTCSDGSSSDSKSSDNRMEICDDYGNESCIMSNIEAEMDDNIAECGNEGILINPKYGGDERIETNKKTFSGSSDFVSKNRGSPKRKLTLAHMKKNIKSPKTQKKKRVRTVMTNYQLKMLRNIFGENQFPSTEIREEIARSIKMTPRSVQIWFQNQRQKHKNEKIELSYSGLDILAEAAEIMWNIEREAKMENNKVA